MSVSSVMDGGCDDGVICRKLCDGVGLPQVVVKVLFEVKVGSPPREVVD